MKSVAVPVSGWMQLLKQLGLALVYAALCWFVLMYFSIDGLFTPIYLPSGLALAVLLIGGWRYSGVVFLGAFLGDFASGTVFLLSVIKAMGSTLAAVCGLWLVTRKGKFNLSLPSMPDYVKLIAFGAFIPSVISTIINVTAMYASGVVTGDAYFNNLRQWWMGDTLGIILMTPLILAWWTLRMEKLDRKLLAEALFILSLTILAGQIIFLGWFQESVSNVAYAFWMFLFAAWAAARLGTRGTTIVLLITAVQSLLSAYERVGFFAHDLDNGIADVFWCFMLVYALVNTSIATYLAGLERAEAKLAASEDRLLTIIENEPECIKIVDGKGRLKQMNRAGLMMIEADSLEQVAGSQVIDVIAPKYRKAFVKMHKRVLAGERMRMEFEIRGLKGTHRWMETHAVPMQDNGETVHLAVTRDVTARKRAEEELRIAAVTFDSQDGVMITDANQLILRVNRAFTRITGYSDEDVIGKNPRLLRSNRHDSGFYAAMWESINSTGGWEGEIWNRRKSGEIYPEYLSITAVKDEEGNLTNFVATLVDITQRKAAEDDIRNLAFYDPLTQLPNRRLLLDRLKQALASSGRTGKKGALLFIDLDNFKMLNDTLGHDVGDLLLKQVAERLTTCVREGDTVARLGGDEFVVMLEDLSESTIEAAAQAEAVGEKILATLSKPYQLGMHEHHNTPSIGATLFNDHQLSLDELLKHADIAMYQAKMSGRNTLRFFDPRMQASITARAALEDRLRHALAENQFELYYQPQVVHDRQVVGAEALIRWHHPEDGLVAPSVFITLAEETGMIVPIGQWVLETACAQIKKWENNPYAKHLQLAVNVSARQFYQVDFVEKVRHAIDQSAIDPTQLKLELTESLLLNDVDDTIQKMQALRKIGVHFSIDDFGTGYSSLSSLKRLPLNQLKIDQSFVRDIPADSDDAVIVQTIIAMAKNLGMEIIAEGVETEEQRIFLEQHGCLVCQGYLFSKPIPIDELDVFLQRS